MDGELLEMRGVSNILNIIGALLAGRGGADSWRGSDAAPVRFRAHPVTRVVAALLTLTISNDAVYVRLGRLLNLAARSISSESWSGG